MASVTFEEPEPNPRGGKRDWAAIADQLQQRPDQWGVIAEDYYASTVWMIHTGRFKAFRPIGRWEATSRGVDQKTNKAEKIYARYLSQPKARF